MNSSIGQQKFIANLLKLHIKQDTLKKQCETLTVALTMILISWRYIVRTTMKRHAMPFQSNRVGALEFTASVLFCSYYFGNIVCCRDTIGVVRLDITTGCFNDEHKHLQHVQFKTTSSIIVGCCHKRKHMIFVLPQYWLSTVVSIRPNIFVAFTLKF